jgi:hypothetical protein
MQSQMKNKETYRPDAIALHKGGGGSEEKHGEHEVERMILVEFVPSATSF